MLAIRSTLSKFGLTLLGSTVERLLSLRSINGTWQLSVLCSCNGCFGSFHVLFVLFSFSEPSSCHSLCVGFLLLTLFLLSSFVLFFYYLIQFYRLWSKKKKRLIWLRSNVINSIIIVEQCTKMNTGHMA